MIAVVSKIYLMKHCDTLITLTENLGRGWEGEWLVQTSHFPCPVFPAPAPFLASSLKPLCKAAIIKNDCYLIFLNFSSFPPFYNHHLPPFPLSPPEPSGHVFSWTPTPLRSPTGFNQRWHMQHLLKLDQTLPTLSFIVSVTVCVRLRIEFSFGFSGLWLIPLIRKSSLYPIVFQDLDEKSLFSKSGSCFHSFACVSWCIH